MPVCQDDQRQISFLLDLLTMDAVDHHGCGIVRVCLCGLESCVHACFGSSYLHLQALMIGHSTLELADHVAGHVCRAYGRRSSSRWRLMAFQPSTELSLPGRTLARRGFDQPQWP